MWLSLCDSPLILSYQPINLFLACSNLILPRPFVNWSASWSSVSIAWTSISWSKTYLRKKWYGIAICFVLGVIFGILANCKHALLSPLGHHHLLSSWTIVALRWSFPNNFAKKVYFVGFLEVLITKRWISFKISWIPITSLRAVDNAMYPLCIKQFMSAVLSTRRVDTLRK